MSDTSKRAGAPDDEIEITSEMLVAGVEAYALFDFEDPGEWVVSAIYRAMRSKEARSR
jgi:hypothetical protein